MFAGTSGRLSPFQKNTKHKDEDDGTCCALSIAFVSSCDWAELKREANQSLCQSAIFWGQPFLQLEVIARKSLYQSLTASLSVNTSSNWVVSIRFALERDSDVWNGRALSTIALGYRERQTWSILWVDRSIPELNSTNYIHHPHQWWWWRCIDEHQAIHITLNSYIVSVGDVLLSDNDRSYQAWPFYHQRLGFIRSYVVRLDNWSRWLRNGFLEAIHESQVNSTGTSTLHDVSRNYWRLLIYWLWEFAINANSFLLEPSWCILVLDGIDWAATLFPLVQSSIHEFTWGIVSHRFSLFNFHWIHVCG